MKASDGPPGFPNLVREFFCERLLKQQNVSPNTVASYRDTFRLLFAFLQKRGRPKPSGLTLADIDAQTVLKFLDELESARCNSIRTRNARLAAIRAFVGYASTRDPTALPLAKRVLAIPQKRFNRPLLAYLTPFEVEALLDAPDQTQWSGRRDRAMFALMYNTGIRVSEAISIRHRDIEFGPSSSVRIHGKGRKERRVPLWKATASLVKKWLPETVAQNDDSPVFPNRHGCELSRSGVEDRLHRAVVTATARCPSLNDKNVSPHTLRHSTAMHMLQSGVDITVIALWLGHESCETTHLYVEADLEMKRRALDRVDAPAINSKRVKKEDTLMEFLDGL
jgi:integrase/recombinase XerD